MNRAMDDGYLAHARVATPIGELVLAAVESRLVGLYVPGHRAVEAVVTRGTPDESPFASAISQLDDYFSGRRQQFSVPMAPVGTPFQLAVWTELVRVPYGQTISYSSLARRIGRPGAARAVGSANARNPISILIPCHRVIGSAGSLTGYAGGLDRKRWLLAHESAVRNQKSRNRVERDAVAQERGPARLTSSP